MNINCIVVNIHFRKTMLWIDGHSIGDNEWHTYGYRDQDMNKDVALIEDYSLKYQWKKDYKDTEYQLYSPRRLPKKLKMMKSFCDPSSVYSFVVTGKFYSQLSSLDKSPQIVFKMNKTTEIFHFDFRLGNPPSYHTWSRSNNWFYNNSYSERQLPEISIDKPFNLTISCNQHNVDGVWKVVLNYWDPSDDVNGIARDPTHWDLEYTTDMNLNPDDVKEIIIEGAWTIYFAGFSSVGCLSLTPTGLVMPLSGNQCQDSNDFLCEYQSCYTKEGFECIFPFTYKDVTYTNCISEDVYIPWCATKMSGNQILEWGLCLDDCDHVPPEPSCIHPPPVPKFGSQNSTGHIINENYISSWFNITNNDDMEKPFKISRDSRKKLYQPNMVYDSNILTELDIFFLAENQFDNFHDVYEIMGENENVSYTCPPGWVFEDSKNVTHYGVCQNWTWNMQFNISKPCVPVFCPEDELPRFPNNSAEGKTNVEEVKSLNTTHWNSWRQRVTYSCPPGYVVETSGSYFEQTDPIIDEEDLRSFSVECGNNAIWLPMAPQGYVVTMPRCIPINCTEMPFPVENNDLGKYNWTGIDGVDPRPFATQIRYYCPRRGWGFPSTGARETFITCEMDGSWSNLNAIEECIKLPCAKDPPLPPSGPGAEFVYGLEMLYYRCQNGYKFANGDFPYFIVECLNRKWIPRKLPACIPRTCSSKIPQHFKG